MKENNLLMIWNYPLSNCGVEKLISIFNIKKCISMYMESKDIIKRQGFYNLYLYNNLDYYIAEYQKRRSVDANILEQMAQYQEQCLSIIYRWRKSYTTKDSYDEILELYYVFLSYWNDLIEKNEINLYILNITPHIPTTFIPYALCKIKHIPTIVLNPIVPIKGEKYPFIYSDGYEGYDANLAKRQDYYLSEIKNGKDVELSDYFRRFFDFERKPQTAIMYNWNKSIKKKMLSYIERGMIYVNREDYRILIQKIVNLMQIQLFEKNFIHKIEMLECDASLEEPFIYFPLQLQPEASTLPRGKWFVHQYLAIKILSESTPRGICIYVKEHPAYWSRKEHWENIQEGRSVKFYEDIIALGNVKFIKHTTSSEDLIKNAVCIATVTGSVGFESMLHFKPIIYFASCSYSEFKFARKVSSVSECQIALEKILNGDLKYGILEVSAYLKALEKYSLTIGTEYGVALSNGVPKYSEDDENVMIDVLRNYYEDFIL